MADTQEQTTKSRRDAFRERFGQKYPDINMDDEEAFYGRINDDYDDYENRMSGYETELGRYRDNEKKLSDMFVADPKAGWFLTQWRKNGDPTVELLKMYGADFKAALEDPSNIDKIAEANKEFAERMAEENRLEEEYQRNLNESLMAIDAYQQENNLTDEQIGDAMNFLQGVAMDMIVGKISVDVLKMAMNAMNYDKDIETAAAEGQVKGRNEKIRETLKKRSKGDGLPQMNGKNGMSPRGNSKYDTLDRLSDRRSIWDK